MYKIINLRKSTTLDDLRCYDGELENADYIFDDNAGGTDGGNESTGEGLTISLTSARTLPTGAEFIAVHCPDEKTRNIIIKLADGTVAWMNRDPQRLPVNGPRKVIGVAEWLVILTSTGIHYARWNGSGYEHYGSAPSAPEGSLTAKVAPLPPYCVSAGEYPVLNVCIPIGSDTPKDVLGWLAGNDNDCSITTRHEITEAVKETLKSFIDDAGNAGLHLGAAMCRLSWETNDGSLWQQSGVMQTDSPKKDTDTPTLTITAADCNDGKLYMALRFSRVPYTVTLNGPEVPKPWDEVIRKAVVLMADNVTDLNADYISTPLWIDSSRRGFMIGTRQINPEDCQFTETEPRGTMSGGEVPENIFSIGGRMLAVQADNRVSGSKTRFPMICEGTGNISGEKLIHLTQSLRPLSSGQLGDFPLYAFCHDGIRALTPAGGSFRDVQLISRDVALSPQSFAPLPDGTCFITKAGVMKIEGTNVTLLSKKLDRRYSENDRLIYLYRENMLLLYNPGEEGIHVYSLTDGKWNYADGSFATHHYGWPDAYVQKDRNTGELTLTRETHTLRALGTEEVLIPVKTRPVKLTDSFTVKKLQEIETHWPDGSRAGVKVYGALRLGKWYFLGYAPLGHAVMRGSGWRFFRFETFVVKRDGNYLVPRIRCRYT